MTLSQRRIGDLQVSAVGLGGMPLSFDHMVDERERAIATVHRALDQGITLIDTANFIGVLIVVNLLALLIYAVAGPLIPVFFWAINGYLLGREYFVLVATRRLGRKAARELRAKNWLRVWIAGTLIVSTRKR